MILYTYRARLSRVVDGDTVDLQVDLGFHLKADLRFRVLGIDTPELRGGTAETKALAKMAKIRVRELLEGEDWPLIIETSKADSFGRWLAAVYYEDPHGIYHLNGHPCSLLTETLIAEGLGVPYSGR